MSNLHLVTGFAGEKHVTSSDQGSYNAALMGNGEFVLERGNQFAASIISNNKVRVLDGDILLQGRHIRLKGGTYFDALFDNGAQGYKRNDLIVVKYSKDPTNDKEKAELIVIKGEAVENNPTDPVYTVGDILDGDALETCMPLYRVPFDGLNIQPLVALFSTVPTWETLKTETLAEVEATVTELVKQTAQQVDEELERLDNAMLKDTYDTNNNGVVDNSEKVNGFWLDFKDANGADTEMPNLHWEDGTVALGDTYIKMTVSASASDNVSLAGQTLTLKDKYTGEVLQTIAYDGQPKTIKVKIGTPYMITGSEKTSYRVPVPVEGVAYEDCSVVVFYQKGTRYGYRRDKNNSDPAGRITYTHDAVGMTPAYTDLGVGNFYAGSWGEFINKIATPVMLNYDGTEAYELDRNNQTKRADGNTSDISNTSFAGNAMVRFEHFKWVQRYQDANYEYVTFSDVPFDETYHAYAHTNLDGEVMDRMYYAMYKGSNTNNVLRSLAGKTVMVSQTRNTEVAYAQANGTGWDTIYNSGWQFVADLLTLIGKTDNSQATFGYGRCATNNSAAIATGTLKDRAGFWGSSNQTSDVKVFWIEGFYGNVWEGMRGCILSGGTIRTKMTPPYNFDAAGYTDTGISPSGTSGGYVNSANVDDLSGYVPKTANGSGTTHYCDGLWFNKDQLDYALVGGAWAYGLRVGSRCLNLTYAPSLAASDFGSRLSYVPSAA